MRNEVVNDMLKYSGRGTIAHEKEVIVISVFTFFLNHLHSGVKVSVNGWIFQL
jgi:hypothetical protein